MIEGRHAPCDEGIIRTGAAAPCGAQAKPWVLAATILGSSLAFLNGSVVNVALPAIQQGLGATAAEMLWVVNGYLLFLGALILTGGSLGDHFGRRRIFVLGILVFMGASVGCGLASGPVMLIALRGVQGIGGALLVPASLAIISATFDKEERGEAICTWAGFSALTTALGPVLGGWLVDAASWRWVFFVVVPFALATIVLTLWRMPESRDREAGALDGAGALLATLGLGALIYGVTASAQAGWGDPVVLGALSLGAAGLAGFLWHERRARDPMMPLGLFRSRAFSGANLLTLFLYFGLNGVLFFLPFNLIQVQGYSALEAGAAFLPFTLLMGFLSRWAGGLIERYGARKPLVIGPLIVAAGFALLVRPGAESTYWFGFFPGLLVLGFGMTVSVAPLTTVVMNAAGEARAGVASGVNNAASRIAGLVAIAVLGVVALAVFSSGLQAQLADMNVPAKVEQAVFEAREDLAATPVPEGIGEDNRQALEAAVDAAFVRAFRWVIAISAVLALLSAGVAMWMIKPEDA